jgi:hypothetical protein
MITVHHLNQQRRRAVTGLNLYAIDTRQQRD